MREWGSEQLLTVLANIVEINVEVWLFAADAWLILKERGHNITSHTRNPVLKAVRMIAEGSLLPEVLVRFGDNSRLTGIVSKLMIGDQRFVLDEPLEVVERSPSGEMTIRKLPASALRPKQLKQVFGKDCIRSEAEQIAYLTDLATVPEWKPKKYDKCKVDKDKGTFTVGSETTSLEDVCNTLRKAGIKNLG